MSCDLSKDWRRVVGRVYLIEGAGPTIRKGVAKAIGDYNDGVRHKTVEMREDGDRIAVAVSKGFYGMVHEKPDRPGITMYDMTFADMLAHAEAQESLEEVTLEVATVAPVPPKAKVKPLPRFARIRCAELTMNGGFGA